MRAAHLVFGSALPCSLGRFPLHCQPAPARPALSQARRQVDYFHHRATGRLEQVDASGARTTENVTSTVRWSLGVPGILLEVPSASAARAHALLEMRTEGRNARAPMTFDSARLSGF